MLVSGNRSSGRLDACRRCLSVRERARELVDDATVNRRNKIAARIFRLELDFCRIGGVLDATRWSRA
jgi:hypothetical protein